jgi:hypothetical protein
LAQLPHRGLNINARFVPKVFEQLPPDVPAGERYLFGNVP